MEKQVLLVDSMDNEIKAVDLTAAHTGRGLLHRAVSVVVYRVSSAGLEILLQKRSHKKLLWPLAWSNAVCTHPAPGEPSVQAAIRRLNEELGIVAPSDQLRFVEKLQYQAAYSDILSENEVDSIYIANLNRDPNPDFKEVAETRWQESQWLFRDMEANPAVYTPWFRLIVKRQAFLDALKKEETL
jgi:isopentenyl-diphosphate delta-isomerase